MNTGLIAAGGTLFVGGVLGIWLADISLTEHWYVLFIPIAGAAGIIWGMADDES